MKPDERRQRRAQFMARVGDEIDAHPAQPILLRQIVQRHDHARRRTGLRSSRRPIGRLVGKSGQRDADAAIDRHALLHLDRALAPVVDHLVDRLEEFGIAASTGRVARRRAH